MAGRRKKVTKHVLKRQQQQAWLWALEGMGTETITTRLGVSKSTVHRWLRSIKRDFMQRLADQGLDLTAEVAEVLFSTHRRTIPTVIRAAVMQWSGGRCLVCGTTENVQIDHIIPVSKGGSNDITNLTVLCGTHNIRKGAALPTELRDRGWP